MCLNIASTRNNRQRQLEVVYFNLSTTAHPHPQLCVQVSINPSYQTHELVYCLEKVGVRALVIDDSFQSKPVWYSMLCDNVPGLSSQPLDSKVSCSTLPNLAFLILNSNNRLP